MSSTLIPSMKETLFDPAISNMGDSLIEIAEIGLDSVLDDGILKDIPILGSIAGLCKAGLSIRERHLIRQTAAFITSFNADTISPEKLLEYRKNLETDPKRADRELSHVILLLDRMIEELQAKMLGKFYKSYVKGGITWEKFCELSEANSRMFISDYEILETIGRKPLKQDEVIPDKKMYQIQRLESLGLIMENRYRPHSDNILSYQKTGEKYVTSPLGGTFYTLMRGVK